MRGGARRTRLLPAGLLDVRLDVEKAGLELDVPDVRSGVVGHPVRGRDAAAGCPAAHLWALGERGHVGGLGQDDLHLLWFGFGFWWSHD